MSDTAIISIIGFITLIATNIFQIYKAKQQRRWDKEDRELTAKQLATTVTEEASRVSNKVDEHNERSAKERAAIAETLTEKLAENTIISEQAFKEANTVNLKLNKLGIENNAIQTEIRDAEQESSRKK